jgi:predicted ATPase
MTAGFIGRERDVAAILAALGRSRLLTLLGSGGVGKTRLASRIADEARDQFPEGVVVVPLAALDDAAFVLPAVAQALGVRESGGVPLLEQVRRTVQTQRLLLVLDNLEHVIAAAHEVGSLLDSCPQLYILATSRVPLGLDGEMRYRVDPLALPDPALVPTVELVEMAPAVQLFVQRARAVAPGFALTPANAAAVAAICRRLDGLPLALELAAAQLALLSLPTLMARLDEMLPLLAGDAHATPARQQTLWRTVAWSYHLLGVREQALFRQLAVFAGGCTPDAVAAACPAASDGAAAGRLLIDALVDTSLVRLDERPEGGGVRLAMLETIRAYALERLEHSGEGELCRRLHAEYYLALAEQAAPALVGPDQGRWLAHLDLEHNNLRAALGWSLQEPGRAPIGLAIAGAIWRF